MKNSPHKTKRPQWRATQDPLHRTYLDPARSVIAKFGGGDVTKGIAVVSKALNCDPSWVYRWMYPKGKRRGRGGEIPAKHVGTLLIEARRLRIRLTLEDVDPKLFRLAAELF